MNVPTLFVVRRWWWRRFHPLTRIGWRVATIGRTRPASQTIIGVGLIAAGLMLGQRRTRTVLYKGTIEPGSGTRIRVYQGDRSIYDQPIGN